MRFMHYYYMHCEDVDCIVNADLLRVLPSICGTVQLGWKQLNELYTIELYLP